jgi:hypothetical protein
VSARCGSDHCVIAGRVDGRLAIWELTGDKATRMAGVPAVNVGDNQPLPAPVFIDGRLVQLVATQQHLTALVRSGSTWSSSRGPKGEPTDAALVGRRLYATVTTGPRTPVTLWRSDVPARP